MYFFLSFMVCALKALPGKEQGNSNKAMTFLFLSKITRPSLEPSLVETKMSAGIVVPLTWKDGRSEKTSVSPVARHFTIFTFT